MARIRSVKPELRTSDLVATWPFEVRYFFVLLWGYLDDKGRGLDIPKQIAGDCFPHDEKVTPSKVDKWLDDMRKGLNGDDGPICRYEVSGRRYVHCVSWSEHQKPNRPTPSRLPQCPIHEGLSEPFSEELHGKSVPGGGEQGSRGDGEGEGSPPQSRCPQHVDIPNPPKCGACKEFRLAREAWDREQRSTVANCRLCGSDGFRLVPGRGLAIEPPVRCNHQAIEEDS